MRLIYLSPVPWTSFAQRPHELVQWFHERTGEQILWIDPYPTRLPTLADFRRTHEKQNAQKETPSWLTVLKPYALPIEPLFALDWINHLSWHQLFKSIASFMSQGEYQIGIGKPSALALRILADAPSHICSFYDAMDDFPAFYSGLSRFAMKQREHAVSNKVKKIFVSSTNLQAHFKYHQEKIELVLNACSSDKLPPIEILATKSSKLVLGYVGTIAHWFDWPLIYEIAKKLPHLTIRLVGPLYSPPPYKLPINVELLPPCSHDTALNIMQEFSVGLIPFQCKELTASVDPIKYYEYRALGLPIISTSFGEMTTRKDIPGVFHVNNFTNLEKLVEEALAYRFDKAEIKIFRDANSWKARFDRAEILPKVR